MEFVTVRRFALLHGYGRVDLSTRTRNGRFRLKESCGGPSSALYLHVGEVSSRPANLKWHTRDLQWNSLLLRAPHPVPAPPRWRSLGQRTISAVDPVLGDELFVEEKQKVLLKGKAKALLKDLKGSCIFLVGMMGSGKTTVGKYVAEGLGYHFFDSARCLLHGSLLTTSDKLVEEAAGGTTVAQMFRAGKEEEFRNAETEVLMQLSSMGRLVVATGGGAVVRPQNWGYLQHGITVWLDVPLEALARRVVAVGCESRPLLGQVSSESAYDQALKCLNHLFEERHEYYSNADAVVSVAALAAIMGLEDVDGVTPTMLAVQVLEEIAILIRNRRRSAGYNVENVGNLNQSTDVR